MSDEATANLVGITDALLAAVRSPNPDLDLVASLVNQRGVALANLPPPERSEQAARFAALQRIQAADAETRSRLVERHAQVRDELRLLFMRPRHQPGRQNRASVIDQVV